MNKKRSQKILAPDLVKLWRKEVMRQVPAVTQVLFVVEKPIEYIQVRMKNGLDIDVIKFKLEVPQEKVGSREWKHVINVLKSKSYEHQTDLRELPAE